MPNIRTYESPVTAFRPSETGVEATAQAGRLAGRFFNQAAASEDQVASSTRSLGAATQRLGSETGQLGSETAAAGAFEGRMYGSAIQAAGDQAVAYVTHREISQGAAAFATLNDNLTQSWNDTAKSADPNDPTVAQKFREQTLEPALEKYRESFLTDGGQKFAESHIDALRNHMFEKTASDMSSLASDAVAVNVRTTANRLSNTAMSDPSSVPHLLDSSDSLVGGMVDSSPNLKGTTAAKARTALTEKMKENVVKSGAVGAIMKAADPEAEAQKWGEQYPQYINGADLKALSANARSQIHARHADATYQRVLQNQEQQQRSDATETGYLQKLYSDNPDQQKQVSATAIVNDPNLTRTSKERMVNLVNREFKPETSARVSAATSVSLMRAMRDPNADPQEINKMIFDARTKDPGTPGSLTKDDFNDLQKQFVDLKTPQGAALAQDRNEFFKRYAGSIDATLAQQGIHSALGEQKMYLAEKDARRQEDQLQRAGQDPHSLYDPASPNFFGNPKNLMKYQVSMKDADIYGRSVGTGSMNLTGPDKAITGTEVIDIPAGMSPVVAMKQYKSGTRIRLPDGRMGTVP